MLVEHERIGYDGHPPNIKLAAGGDRATISA
jgi:hypothetical protein